MDSYASILGIKVPNGKMVLRKEKELHFWGIDNNTPITWTLISEELYKNILEHELEYKIKHTEVIDPEIVSPI